MPLRSGLSICEGFEVLLMVSLTGALEFLTNLSLAEETLGSEQRG